MTLTTIILKLAFLGMLLTMSAIVQGFAVQPQLATSSISKRTQLTAAKKGKPEEKPKFMFGNLFSPPQPAANKKKPEVKPVKKPLLGDFVFLFAKPQINWLTMEYFDKDNMGYESKRMNWVVKPKTDEPDKKKKKW
jgi:hypothetical protein